MRVVNRSGPAAVALETTLLCHGVPRDAALGLFDRLGDVVRSAGASPTLVGLVDGVPIAGMTRDELGTLLAAAEIPKVNTSRLGAAIHRREHGATTVATTMEIATAVGLTVFATGGIGGVHRESGARFDISADLAALARYPVAVVASGSKGLLDVSATRECLETLGIPIVGFRTDSFPAFYVRETDLPVDVRFDDAVDLAGFVKAELGRTERGMLICNPAPASHAMSEEAFEEALRLAMAQVPGIAGRDVTPALLGALHEITGGKTLDTNIALALSNARLAGELATAMARRPSN